MIPCLSRIIFEFKADIVRLISETVGDGGYPIRISLSIPDTATEAYLATLQNSAEGLHLSYHAETARAARNETLNRRAPVLTLKRA